MSSRSRIWPTGSTETTWPWRESPQSSCIGYTLYTSRPCGISSAVSEHLRIFSRMLSTSCCLRVASIARYAATACGTEWLYPRRKRSSLISPDTSSYCGNSSRSEASSIRLREGGGRGGGRRERQGVAARRAWPRAAGDGAGRWPRSARGGAHMRVSSGASSVVVSGSTSSVSSCCEVHVASCWLSPWLGISCCSRSPRDERRRGVMTLSTSCSICGPCSAPSVTCRSSVPPPGCREPMPREKECAARRKPVPGDGPLAGCPLLSSGGGSTASGPASLGSLVVSTSTLLSATESTPATCGSAELALAASASRDACWLERHRRRSMRTTRYTTRRMRYVTSTSPMSVSFTPDSPTTHHCIVGGADECSMAAGCAPMSLLIGRKRPLRNQLSSVRTPGDEKSLSGIRQISYVRVLSGDFHIHQAWHVISHQALLTGQGSSDIVLIPDHRVTDPYVFKSFPPDRSWRESRSARFSSSHSAAAVVRPDARGRMRSRSPDRPQAMHLSKCPPLRRARPRWT